MALRGPGRPGPLAFSARAVTLSALSAHHPRARPHNTPHMTAPNKVDGPMRQAPFDVSARRPRRDWDRVVARMAARQHGVVALWQLEGVGIGRTAAHWRVKVGRWHQLHEGVYAVGHVPSTRECALMAAVLACGPGAVLSHQSAGELWGVCDFVHGPIDVTAPGRRGRSPGGISSHRDDRLEATERTSAEGIPYDRGANSP